MANLHDFSITDIDGQSLDLSSYKGKAVLIVNVASKCGLTPQYEGLEKLYADEKDNGLVVLGLPCNQFLEQEPGTEEEIKSFCSLTYGVSFPMGSKLEVNGPNRHALYEWLVGEGAAFPGDITWNFEKFLVNKEGDVVARFEPKTAPDDPDLQAAVSSELG